MFADNSAVLVDDEAEATDILYDITRVTQSYGLTINTDKTKVLTSDDKSPAIVQLNDNLIEQVREFKYLRLLVQEQK